MKNLKLHANGKQEYLHNLLIEFNEKLGLVKQDMKLAPHERETAMQNLKTEYEQLKSEADRNLY